MNGMQYLAVVLLVAGTLGWVGHAGATVSAQPEVMGCNGPAMMGDEMHGPAMMGDEMHDPAMMDDEMHDPAMMGGEMLQARDGQCLAGQAPAIQAAFVAVWGDHAGARWVEEHEAELAMMDPMMH